jgi:hypothetical protein
MGLSWNEHLFYTLVFCRTHIRQAFRKKYPDHPATGVIEDILAAEDLRTVHTYITEAIAKWPETEPWFKNKKVPWVLSGITRGASKIPINWWKAAQHHTGACESSHFMENEAVGRKKSLLGAVLGYD